MVAANGELNGHNGAVRSGSEREPIAIIGIGCRFPGDANDPASFWKILSAGRDVLTDIPPDRWSLDLFYDPQAGRVGRTNVRFGGFIKGIDQFDAQFFGISPREAAFMDPQQRLLLEVAWEALEDGGQVIERLAGSHTSVYVGISSFDYSMLQSTAPERETTDVYSNTGGALSIAANRISYCFNFKGPSAAVDTACSSSLLAVHLACESLWTKTSPLALAGGVHVLLAPGPYIGFSRLNMLSADGRCKAFDARANGFVRSEGAGVVLLKPLSAALADGDRIYALIRGTAINQDGRTPGLTVPSQQSQAALVREACQKGGVDPSRIRFVEAHGTGTLVGDPIEARALGEALSQDRPAERPCFLGSVKTNIGHMEAAAAMPGLIKAALTLQHRQIPPNLHFEQPNPEIPLEELRLRVPVKLEPWPQDDGPAFAGVNSFGFGGTNAHAVLEETPSWVVGVERIAQESSHDSLRPELVPLSARSDQALVATARSLASWLNGEGAEHSFAAICRSAALRRSHHEYRLSVVARSRAELAERLQRFAAGELDAEVSTDRVVPHQQPRLAFVCSGQGPQWWAMGRQLLAEEPVFRDMIERCDQLMRPLGDWSLLEELLAEEKHSRMDVTAISQPAIFAVQVALASLWESWGVRPDAVVGHSVGEAAAAYIAGALSLEDAMRVIFHRGRCMECAPTRGRMLAVGLSREEAEHVVNASAGQIFLAAVNSPTSISLSGEPEVLEALAQDLQKRQVFNRFLQVNYAFHSAQMDGVREPLLEALRDIRPRQTRIPFFSTVTGQLVEGPELTGDYWWRNVRQTVLFTEAMDHLIEKGHDAVVELSPHPVLGSAVAECSRQHGKKVKVLASLRRKEPERLAMLRALAGLHNAGRTVDWPATAPAGKGWVRLPSYSWQHERFWQEPEGSREFRFGKQGHPLLGGTCRAPEPSWERVISGRIQPYLADHRVQGAPLFPTTGYLEMAVAAGQQLHGPGSYVVEEVKLLKACFLPEGQTRVIQTCFHPENASFSINSRNDMGDKTWTTHVRGILRSWQDKPSQTPLALDEIKGRCRRESTGPECYVQFKKVGLDYGPLFQGMQHLWQGDGESLALVRSPEPLLTQLDSYTCHPAILDACLQAVMGVLPEQHYAQGAIVLPVEIDEVRVHGPLGRESWSHARLVEMNQQGVAANLGIYNEQGQLVVEMRGLQCQIIGGNRAEYQGAESQALGASEGSLADLLYEYQWQFQPRATRAQATRSLEYLSGLEPLRERMVEHVRKLERESDLLDRFTRIEPALNHLCVVYIQDALRQLGGRFRSGERFTTRKLAEQLGIADQHERVLGRYLTLLEQDGFVRASEGDPHWEVVGNWPVEDAEALWRDLLSQHPAFFGELMLIRRCGRQLAEVLRGEVNPLQLIFPEGSLSLAEHLYQDSPSVRFYHTLAQQTVREVLAALPPGRIVRVLEIGAGTGGLTSYLLPWLPEGRTEYTFTDMSNHFFVKAQQKFAGYPFVNYQKLDIESPPAEQGFAEHGYDLIVASQVLHATTDLRRTLTNVRQLLSSEGLLVLLESIRPRRWVDLVFGLTEGWWRFSDLDVRPTYPLLSFPGWSSLLADVGFQETADVAGDNGRRGLESAVILSRGPVIEQGQRVAVQDEAPGNWLLFADHGGTAERLAGLLRSRGDHCTLVFAGEAYANSADGRITIAPGSMDDMQRLVRDALSAPCAEGKPGQARTWDGLVHLWNLDFADAGSVPVDGASALQVPGCMSVVQLVQAWNQLGSGQAPRLWLVSCHAQVVDPRTDRVAPMQAPLWGLGRVVINEDARYRCTLVDLGGTSLAELQSLVEEMRHPDEEEEIALRGEARYIHRFMRTTLEKQGTAVRSDSTTGEPLPDGEAAVPAFRLEVSRAAVLDGLTPRATRRQQPGTGQVEVRVMAAALNFSDVMKALGLYPGLPDGPVPLGIECAGVIVAVGPDVKGFRVGDEVVAIAPGSFGSYVLTSALLTAHKPMRINFEEAATLPVAFLTAAYALDYLGRMGQGERVLIHAASGGVGLAAIQLAQRAGAEVFATAGSPEKRQFLQALGVEHIMNSRTLAFADEVMERTAGRGVDLVLNSLAGEAIPRSLGTLADYGRFLEIGKRDIYGNSRIGLKPFRKNLSFFAIDLDRAMRERPAALAGLFQKLMEEVNDGHLWPLPHRVFSIGNVVSAFRYMSQAKHMGKVVISMDDRVKIAPENQAPLRFRGDGTYLLTGGLGGFGLTVAQWMAEQGARHFVLMGRRGVHSPETARQVEELRRAGAEVVVAQGDVSKVADVSAVLADIARNMPPLRGVLHAAMVLDDCLVANMTQERWQRAVAPKMDGAWILHQLTRDLPLDCFILFSSLSGLVGLPGQANYSAANTFLDALAGYRRSLGLPALTVSWGFLGEVGYVARNEKVAERLESQGGRTISPRQAMVILGGLLQHRAVHVGAASFDWSMARMLGTSGNLPRRFSYLHQEADSGKESGKQDAGSIRKSILTAPLDKRLELVVSFLHEKVSQVLGTSSAKVVDDKPLTELGLDSLMGVELRNWIEGELRVNLPIVELMQGPTITRLAELLLAQLTANSGDAKPAAAPPVVPATAPATPQPADSGPAPATVRSEPATNGHSHKTGLTNGEAHLDEKEQAQALLEELPNLSDADVDSLLDSMLPNPDDR